MKKMIVGGVAAVVVVAVGAWMAISADAKKPTLEEKASQIVAEVQKSAAEIEPAAAVKRADLPSALLIQPYDRVVGNPNAPVQIIEYASMTCMHCKTFHTQIYPELKKEFIDTGKASFVFRPLPWDDLALAISQVAFCAEPHQTGGFISAFFDTYDSWIRSKTPLEEIKRVSRLGGMTPEQVKGCIMNPDLRQTMTEMKRVALDELNVKSTPTLFVNDVRLEGVHRMPVLRETIENFLQ